MQKSSSTPFIVPQFPEIEPNYAIFEKKNNPCLFLTFFQLLPFHPSLSCVCDPSMGPNLYGRVCCTGGCAHGVQREGIWPVSREGSCTGAHELVSPCQHTTCHENPAKKHLLFSMSACYFLVPSALLRFQHVSCPNPSLSAFFLSKPITFSPPCL